MAVKTMQFSTKRLQITKTNARIIIIVGVAVFVAIFSLVSSKALWTQRSYQARLITKKELARDNLKKNLESVEVLANSYKSFTGSAENVLGGNPAGTGEKDGDNATVVLDALPSKYDFPALTTSLEKLLTDKKFKINSITGTDDEIAQSKNTQNDNPVPIEVPFQASVTGSYQSVQELVTSFEKSIRPFNMSKLSFSGNNTTMQFSLTANTYYQPEKTLNIKQVIVK